MFIEKRDLGGGDRPVVLKVIYDQEPLVEDGSQGDADLQPINGHRERFPK